MLRYGPSNERQDAKSVGAVDLCLANDSHEDWRCKRLADDGSTRRAISQGFAHGNWRHSDWADSQRYLRNVIGIVCLCYAALSSHNAVARPINGRLKHASKSGTSPAITSRVNHSAEKCRVGSGRDEEHEDVRVGPAYADFGRRVATDVTCALFPRAPNIQPAPGQQL